MLRVVCLGEDVPDDHSFSARLDAGLERDQVDGLELLFGVFRDDRLHVRVTRGAAVPGKCLISVMTPSLVYASVMALTNPATTFGSPLNDRV